MRSVFRVIEIMVMKCQSNRACLIPVAFQWERDPDQMQLSCGLQGLVWWSWKAKLVFYHQPAQQMSVSVIGTTELKTPDSSWPVNSGNPHQHPRSLDQNASWAYLSPTPPEINTRQRPGFLYRHADYLGRVVSVLSYGRRGPYKRIPVSIYFRQSGHHYLKLPPVL